MTVVVKLMSGEDMPDDDTRKSFKLKTGVLDVEFARDDGHPYVWLWYRGADGLAGPPTQLLLTGNVYVMNEAGKTVASFGVHPPESREAHTDEVDTVVSNGASVVLPKAVANDIVNTLDCLGLALVEHQHKWSAEQHRAYNLSIKSLGGKSAVAIEALKPWG